MLDFYSLSLLPHLIKRCLSFISIKKSFNLNHETDGDGVDDDLDADDDNDGIPDDEDEDDDGDGIDDEDDLEGT